MSSMNPPAWFVTGTDTEIGKTLVTCALLHALGESGVPAAGLKPVAAGGQERRGKIYNEDVVLIGNAASVHLPPQVINPWLLHTPMAPHLAAKREGREIDMAPIAASYTRAMQSANAVVVEGVGGFRVPLSDKFDSADLAQLLAIPVVLVVGMRLGCINHALLTAEAITHRNLHLAGWVANTVDPDMLGLQDNIVALRERLQAPFLGAIPRLARPTPAAAAAYLDFTRMTGWPVHA